METNYFGYVYCTHYALPHLRKSKKPRIIVISSLSAEIGVPLRTGYCASKFAVNGFFDSLRMELGPSMPITLIEPGYVQTNIRNAAFGAKDFEPDAAMISPERCAEMIMDAADQGKKKVILTLSGRLAVSFRPFFPDIVDNAVRKRALARQKTQQNQQHKQEKQRKQHQPQMKSAL